MTIALSATGHGAMECTITNACQKGETILIACNGIWGDRAADMAKRAGVNVERLEGTPGVSFKLDQIESSLKKVTYFIKVNNNRKFRQNRKPFLSLTVNHRLDVCKIFKVNHTRRCYKHLLMIDCRNWSTVSSI